MMRQHLLLILTVVLAACGARGSNIGQRQVLLDQRIPLIRGAVFDEAVQEFDVVPGTTMVAIADEDGADLTLWIQSEAQFEKVDSNLQGEGKEIAVLDAGAVVST